MFGTETANEGSSTERHRHKARVISLFLSFVKLAHGKDLNQSVWRKSRRPRTDMGSALRWMSLIALGLMIQGMVPLARLVSEKLR